MQAVSIMQT